jgi:hypothetical protein
MTLSALPGIVRSDIKMRMTDKTILTPRFAMLLVKKDDILFSACLENYYCISLRNTWFLPAEI